MAGNIWEGAHDVIDHSNKAFKMSIYIVLQALWCFRAVVFWIIISIENNDKINLALENNVNFRIKYIE